MSIRNAFGRLLLSVSGKLKRLAETLGVMDTGLEDTTEITSRVLIWDVLDGPFLRDDFDEDFLFEEGIEEDREFMIVVKMEEDGKIGRVNLWLKTEEEADSIMQHFKNSITPLELVE